MSHSSDLQKANSFPSQTYGGTVLEKYLGNGLHHWLWKRPTVSNAGHAAITYNLKAKEEGKKDREIPVRRFLLNATWFTVNLKHN